MHAIYQHFRQDPFEVSLSLRDATTAVTRNYGRRMNAADNAADIAKAVAENFVEVFNSRDLQRNREALNYPSVILVRGRLVKWDRPEDYSVQWDRLTESEGWHHSTLDSAEVVQAGTDKVHLKVSFSRYDADGVKYTTHHGLWVITLVEGHWGIQCRSNFAP